MTKDFQVLQDGLFVMKKGSFEFQVGKQLAFILEKSTYLSVTKQLF